MLEQAAFLLEARVWVPLYARGAAGRLSGVSGESLEHHLAQLGWVRGLLDGVFGPMTLPDFRRARALPDDDMTPVVLMQLPLFGQADVALFRFQTNTDCLLCDCYTLVS